MSFVTNTTGRTRLTLPSPQSEAEERLASRLVDLASGVGGLEEIQEIADTYRSLHASLSLVEREVLGAFVRGLLNKQIACQQNVSMRTVEERRRRVYLGMGISSSALLAFAAGIAATVEVLGEDDAESLTASSSTASHSAFSIETLSKNNHVLESDAVVAPR